MNSSMQAAMQHFMLGVMLPVSMIIVLGQPSASIAADAQARIHQHQKHALTQQELERARELKQLSELLARARERHTKRQAEKLNRQRAFRRAVSQIPPLQQIKPPIKLGGKPGPKVVQAIKPTNKAQR